MARILIDPDSEEPDVIALVGEISDYAAIVDAHGYDSSADEWEVDDSDADLQEAIQNASTLQELKDALTDSAHPAQARGRGR